MAMIMESGLTTLFNKLVTGNVAGGVSGGGVYVPPSRDGDALAATAGAEEGAGGPEPVAGAYVPVHLRKNADGTAAVSSSGCAAADPRPSATAG